MEFRGETDNTTLSSLPFAALNIQSTPIPITGRAPLGGVRNRSLRDVAQKSRDVGCGSKRSTPCATVLSNVWRHQYEVLTAMRKYAVESGSDEGLKAEIGDVLSSTLCW